MFVASFLRVIVNSVPGVWVTGESLNLNWKNHCPMRSAAGSLAEKFRNQYTVSLMQLSHVMLVWLKHTLFSHFVGGLGTPLSMNTDKFKVISGSPDEAVIEKFQLGTPQPPSDGTPATVKFSSFFTGSKKNSPGSPADDSLVVKLSVWLVAFANIVTL